MLCMRLSLLEGCDLKVLHMLKAQSRPLRARIMCVMYTCRHARMCVRGVYGMCILEEVQ